MLRMNQKHTHKNSNIVYKAAIRGRVSAGTAAGERTEFVSLVSHQLRTPLSIINWYAEILESENAGALNDHQKKYVAEIVAANRRMIELINNLLDISRIESGSFVINPVLLDVRDVSRTAIEELEPAIFERRLEVCENYASDVPYIEADEGLVKIIFQNLLSNAVKYTPPEGRVDVSIVPRGRRVCFRVKDNGYGIPDDDRTRIFQRLFRSKNVQAHNTEGTGFGLYLVKNIIDVTGGVIQFRSKEGKGSTFEVMLPLQSVHHQGMTVGTSDKI